MKYCTVVRRLIVLAMAAAAAAGTAAAETLSLNDYIAQVSAKNPELKAVDHSIEAMSQKILELDMVYSPLLKGSYNYTDDRSGLSYGSPLPADRITGGAVNVNASKKFMFGSNVSVGVDYLDYTFNLMEPTLIDGTRRVSQFTDYDIKPYVRVEQSLLRDFNSALTMSGIRKERSAMAAARYGQVYRRQQIHMNATLKYWTLSLAREVVQFRRLSLARTEKLLSWNEKRVNLDLADSVDYLQAQAAYKQRQLNLQNALETAVEACRDVNDLLGETSELVSWDTDSIAQISNSPSPLEQTGTRADVLAARAQFESSEYAKAETKYRARPELSLNGMYSLHGIALSANDAWTQLGNTEKPAYMVGVSFVVPLDFATLRKVQSGFEKDYLSAQESLSRTEISCQNDWDQLLVTLANVRQRLQLAMEIRDIQEKRVAQEVKRFTRGRTTTFQLLEAENDLDEATLSVYRLRYEELATLAQAKLYNNKEESSK